MYHNRYASIAMVIFLASSGRLFADPCGMVPPITSDGTVPITRIGEQRTYVFYKDGVETIVIRPGFSGNVDEFGMLIPFPTPPSLRKAPDAIFEHIAAAIDPPEVVIDLRRRMLRMAAAPSSYAAPEGLNFRQKVRVLREEAVGMYEIAVLEAGSAAALKLWMDGHGYRYPDGMDTVCNDYVDDGWCFVAVKTKVGQKGGVDPKPGQRIVSSKLPDGATFDGNVQAMGFRFKTDSLVVPMRLSAFNKGELRNIVYLLTDGPRRIRKIPEQFVVRQIPGKQLVKNVTQLLPLRIIGGGPAKRRIGVQPLPTDPTDYQQRRDPHPKNGAAKELFASDLLAVASGELSLPHEEQEKELLEIGERLGLRGPKIDRVNAQALSEASKATVERSLNDLESMTLTIVDGDFPRDVIAGANLTFASYTMPAHNNTIEKYDAKTKKPWKSPGGELIGSNRTKRHPRISTYGWAILPFSFIVLARRRRRLESALLLLLVFAPAVPTEAFQVPPKVPSDYFTDRKDASAEVKTLVERAQSNPSIRQEVVASLLEIVRSSTEVTRQGWAIVALGEIGGYDVDEQLLAIHADEKQPQLVRTWAAAARVSMTKTSAGLIEKAQLIAKFPALGRPIGMRLIQQLNSDGDVSVEKLVRTSLQVPQIQQAITPAILAKGANALVETMSTSTDQNVRRQSAAYLGTLAQQDASVPSAVIDAYRFHPSSSDVAWKGGPLFIPALNWEKEDARDLAGSLVAWHLWCDRNGHGPEQRQIHNNLRSLALAKAAGYESPGFREANTVTWLTIWGKAVGKDALREMLQQQDAINIKKYTNVLKEL